MHPAGPRRRPQTPPKTWLSPQRSRASIGVAHDVPPRLGRRSSASVCEFQGYEAGNRDSEVELPDDRLQIGQAAGEWIDRDDVPVTRGGQRGEAEIQHGRHFLRTARSGKEIDEGARAQLPDQAKGRGEDRREAQIKYDRTLKAVKCNPTGSIDRVRYYPSQRGEGENVAAAAEHGG